MRYALNGNLMILLTDDTSVLEIDLASWDGDAYVTVRVDSRGYAGANDVYVLDSEFRQFCSNLLKLQETLKGQAVLSSVSPGELEIRLEPFDALGHISVIGKLGYHMFTRHSSNWHSVEFGFEFDPQQLDGAARVDWVRKYAI